MPSLYLGSLEVPDLTLGSDGVELYLGATRIWPAEVITWASTDPYADDPAMQADWPSTPTGTYYRAAPGLRCDWSGLAPGLQSVPAIPTALVGETYRVDFTLSNTFNLDDHFFQLRFSAGGWDADFQAQPPSAGDFSFTATCTTPATNVPLQIVLGKPPPAFTGRITISDITVVKL
jgi:hypothetical protein